MPLPDATPNQPYSHQIGVTGGVPPYFFMLTDGSLPPGLEMDDSGLITGTPTCIQGAVFPFIVAFQDSTGAGCDKEFTITCSSVCNPLIAPALDSTLGVAGVYCCYATSSDRLFATTATDVIVVNPASGAIGAHLGIPAAPQLIAYENVNNRIYVGYFFGSAHIRIFSANAPYGLIDDITISSTTPSGVPLRATFDPGRNKMWFSDAQNIITVLDCFLRTYTTIDLFLNPTTPPFSPSLGLSYCSSQDRVAIFGELFMPDTSIHEGMVTVQAGSLGVIGAYDVFSTWEDACSAYCDLDGFVYVSMDSSGVLKVNPGNGASGIIPFNPNHNGAGIVYNPCTRRLEVFEGFGADLIKARYLDPVTSSIVTISTGEVLSNTPPAVPVYDSSRARVWLSTGNKILRFT